MTKILGGLGAGRCPGPTETSVPARQLPSKCSKCSVFAVLYPVSVNKLRLP